MSRFVDECRKEWARLGVPDAEANEMATDLEADLTEAQADGVTPEEVRTIRIRTLVLGLGALVGAVVAAAGLVLLAGSRVGQQVVAAPLTRHISRPVPGILVTPHDSFLVSGPGGANLDVLGGVLLAVGLIGLAVILWVWRPWSILRSGSGFDQNVGMPSYL